MTGDEKLVELLQHLEELGRPGIGLRPLEIAVGGELSACVALGVDYTSLPYGTIQTSAQLVATRVLGFLGIQDIDLEEAKTWFDAINDDKFSVEIIVDSDYRECFLLKWTYYIPVGKRQVVRDDVATSWPQSPSGPVGEFMGAFQTAADGTPTRIRIDLVSVCVVKRCLRSRLEKIEDSAKKQDAEEAMEIFEKDMESLFLALREAPREFDGSYVLRRLVKSDERWYWEEI